MLIELKNRKPNIQKLQSFGFKEQNDCYTYSADNAIVRRKDNKKWYIALLTISRRKLGLDSDEMVEILDLRMKPEDIEAIVDNRKYFPGYHMNKNHWITVCLDETVSFDEISGRIDESYNLAVK